LRRSNAVNASPPGGQIRLRSTLEGSLWRVSLEDEGTGVPLAERERIFDRFMRLKSSAAANQEGSGLGLAICRGIIGLHDGRIFAEAGTDGRGLRVVFEIPAEPAAAHAPLSLNAPATTVSA
jgi:signal transduction histidine kinase